MKPQTILWSRGAFEDALTQVLQQAGPGKALLVCDSAFPHLEISRCFRRLDREMVRFDGFSPNPRYEEAAAGAALFRQEGCRLVIAVGGGSAIDVAKCIKLFCGMDPSAHYLKQEFREPEAGLLAVPTTAGTGSESTRFAVVYDQGEKQSVTSDWILPDWVILEPETLKSLPLYQKKATMLDALCQAIESWWSVNSTPESMALSRQAVTGIMEHYQSYLSGVPQGRTAIMEAANQAGRAINITQTTAAHAMCYKITSLYGTSHGHAAALCLPKVWRFMLDHLEQCCDPRGRAHLERVFSAIAQAMGEETPQQAAARFESLLQELELTAPVLKEKEHIHKMAASVNPVRLKNNPVTLTQEDFSGLYREIFAAPQ